MDYPMVTLKKSRTSFLQRTNSQVLQKKPRSLHQRRAGKDHHILRRGDFFRWANTRLTGERQDGETPEVPGSLFPLKQ